MVSLLSWNKLEDDERALAQFVQGILNRKGQKIFIDIDNYKLFLKEEYEEENLWKLLEENITEFSGAVCYNLNCNDVGINMAAMLSAASDALGVPHTLIEKVNALGLKTVRPLADIK